MRILLAIVCLIGSFVVPQASSAEDLALRRPAEPMFAAGSPARLAVLLRALGIAVIPSAHAAECTREGETCTSDEQCCPGLECSGGPPATCVDED